MEFIEGMEFIKELILDSSLNPSRHPNPTLWRESLNAYHIKFDCMASNCSILIECEYLDLVISSAQKAIIEAWRIEHKFSRYQQNNTFSDIHSKPDAIQKLDDETTQLMLFAHHAFHASEGLFDITSGILRRAWKFDGSDNLPTQKVIDTLLTKVGWNSLGWDLSEPSLLTLPSGMELDFGGIGKEYAVDKMLNICRFTLSKTKAAILINCGGDLACSGRRLNGESWKVGIESINDHTNAKHVIALSSGALATSGDSRRFLIKDGVRYSHVLNPINGWALTDAPRSVTVAAPTCVNAGILSTLALLQGAEANHFLESLNMPYWLSISD
ncbi:FAD:protein FMN transferase [Marinomonas mediterranea]|jgi:Membrane-associated lipoprotein involved in thiamine biosynthesis|uniref:FAD:protein FMN transferase n=1 Tax=Marinomonas mediterranea (strain ATCC 700492 / JCM 21426 / NBRC 103028 / MMB-1) TaxID=717774 RepID=F2K0R9_MARM1|nr:FAD:protein FMN transferase [Marinomonas mediterranea]ADZ92161.1 ApbE family lipoprotein [Marinomonas mediterranea MMB-1]